MALAAQEALNSQLIQLHLETLMGLMVRKVLAALGILVSLEDQLVQVNQLVQSFLDYHPVQSDHLVQ